MNQICREQLDLTSIDEHGEGDPTGLGTSMQDTFMKNTIMKNTENTFHGERNSVTPSVVTFHKETNTNIFRNQKRSL
jgi:hypothetical protein